MIFYIKCNSVGYPYLDKCGELIIKVVPMVKHAVGNVYHEIDIPYGVVDFRLDKVKIMNIEKYQ